MKLQCIRINLILKSNVVNLSIGIALDLQRTGCQVKLCLRRRRFPRITGHSDRKKTAYSTQYADDVAGILEEQAAALRQKIEALRKSLWELERLRNEVLQMQTVDFKKYADITINLQMKNDYYWLIKHFDEQLLDHIRNRFDKESGMVFIEAFQLL